MIRQLRIVDSLGKEIHLGDEIGKGGEGSVYAIEGDECRVAKLYHQRPMPQEAIEKLRAMIAARTPELESIAAWPQSFIHDPRSREVLGILMLMVADSRHLHELYGTSNRRRHFPEAKWHHLVLAARNVAAAFESLHAAGVVIGDVNQGNMLVDQHMCVRFIDCDSFQIEREGQLYPCPVGTPHFTPPELQSQRLSEVRRTINHDGFGMAIVIFHLLFVGRHPFAGRFQGSGDMTIEQAIAEHRFAFSRRRDETQVEPPPASLLLEDLPSALAELFELAFQSPDAEGGRPQPSQWVTHLEQLIKQRSVCSLDHNHVFSNHARQCPWCRIEDEGGPPFFVTDTGASIISAGRLEELDRRVQHLQVPEFVDLSPAELAIPKVLKAKKLKQIPPATVCDAASTGMAAAGCACLLGIKWVAALWLGTVGSLGAGAFLVFSTQGRQRRQRSDRLLEKLAQYQQQLAKVAQVITKKYAVRKHKFEQSVEQLKREYQQYQAGEQELQDVLTLQRTAQFNRFLSQQLIREHATQISGLTLPMLSVLESYGVESALDVDNLKLMVVPMLSSKLVIELLAWRERMEGAFKYQPDHGITFEDAEQASDWAHQRFKISQARKVLTGGKQLVILADVGKAELRRELGSFETVAEQGRAVARKLRDFQGGRRLLERVLNSHPLATLGIACALPVVGFVLRKLFG